MDLRTLIFSAHSSSRYSMAALVGAVETDSRLQDLNIEAPLNLGNETVLDALSRGGVAIAYSVMSTQAQRVYEEVRRVRQRFGSDVCLIGGGAHASIRPRELLDNGFDYVIVGEGEESFPELLVSLLENGDPNSIAGVVTRESTDIPRPKDLPVVDLDRCPPFALKRNLVGPVEVTRGCPFSCKFCSTPFLTGGRVHHRSVDNIVTWLERAVTERGFERTWFLSPNALSYGGRGRDVNPGKIEGLLRRTTAIEGLKEVFFGSFPSEVRPEFVTDEVLEIMRSYVANRTLQIGLQSSSNRVLKLINRHHTVEDGMNAIRIALDAGFIPHVDMIFGLPGETIEERHASIELCYTLAEMGAKTHGHVFMPLPGSEFEHMPPGRLDDESRRLLGELSRRKLMTGSWSSQEAMGEKLVS
ncbi:MAG: TIGR04013 family B12-binding domain/radical SAM domain-containing protein [Candidatus Thorarchaeota archaeon]|nr:MAG: TIGR04013 family B12-binding domain/radical SAM domain-containing protein [Candidatus Thorarchaeota archaeon]RLI59682.1 MAG: TIGR04013 family B12-binding domain/radical SAM domain-containing protein [Candidatus Thorarchaeota archaeon]